MYQHPEPDVAERDASQSTKAVRLTPESRRRRGGVLFAFSGWDMALVVISLGETVLLAFAVSTVSRAALASSVAALGYCVLGAFLVFMNCTNYQCVAHNFIHNPFFRSRRLNSIFSILNSLALGVPQTLYRFHHLNHHKYGNDYRDPVTGATRDRSSTYRYSNRPEAPEALWKYALIGPFRLDLRSLLEDARRAGHLLQAVIETAAWALFAGALFWVDWKGALIFYLPVWYLGQASAYAENYLEHNHAIPSSRETDSVSCYGKAYNFVWFNNGYHQEHHYRPQVHWRDVKKLRVEIRPESQRQVVRGAHWFNV